MARPRKFVEDDVITKAGVVFATKGYAGTTLEDLAAATGLGKQSLYNSFGGKRELFLRALRSDAKVAVGVVKDALSGSSSTPLERIRGQLLTLAVAQSGVEAPGSLFTNATVELGHRDAEISESALDALRALQEVYRRCIVDAQKWGEVHSAAGPIPLAAFYVAVPRGMEVLGAAGMPRAGLTTVALTAFEALPLTLQGQRRRQAD